MGEEASTARAILLRAHNWLKIGVAVWLLVRGDWAVVLAGFAVMFVAGFLFHVLLVVLVRVLGALPHITSIGAVLGRRRTVPVLILAFLLMGQLFAGVDLAAFVAFAGGEGGIGGDVAKLLWAYVVAAGVFSAADLANAVARLGWTDGARLGMAAVLVLQYQVDPPLWVVAATLTAVMLAATLLVYRRLRQVGKAATAESLVAWPATPPEASPPIGPAAPVLVVIPLPSTAGTAFADQVTAAGERLGYRVERLASASYVDTFNACIFADAVVFDATVESEVDHNLAAAVYALRSAYAVSASRTYLPLNFPDLDPCAPPYPSRWENAELVPLVVERLTMLRERVPRPADRRGHANIEAIFQTGFDDAAGQRHRRVFVSFRGRHERDVDDLVSRLSASDPGRTAKFFFSGELALGDELMSLQRRWEVLRHIERWILAADEIWIYWSPDYLESWWTRAELTLAVMAAGYAGDGVQATQAGDGVQATQAGDGVQATQAGDGVQATQAGDGVQATQAGDGVQATHAGARVVSYDPATGRTTAVEGPDLPRFRRGDAARIRKLLFFAMQPETAQRLRSLAASRVVATAFGLRDETLTTAFTDDLLLQCPDGDGHRGASPNFNVGGLLSLTDPPLHAVATGAVQEAVAAGGSLRCPVCGRDYVVETAAPHWRWYPVRSQGQTGPGGMVVEQLPNYRVVAVQGPRT